MSLGASPCFESKQNSHPDITFTTQENTTSGTHVSFSAQRNDLTPLQVRGKGNKDQEGDFLICVVFLESSVVNVCWSLFWTRTDGGNNV